MYELIGRILQNVTIPEIIMIFICSCVFLITIASLITNFIDWVVSVYLYSKSGWFQFNYPNFKDVVVKIKYTHYILGEITGEIFYIDGKRLKKLKRKKLVHWGGDMCCYIFRDEDVENVKDVIRPLIILHNSSNKSNLIF